jgi:hypothetical protein
VLEEQKKQLQRKTYALYYQLVKNVSEGIILTCHTYHPASITQHLPITGVLAANVVFDLNIPILPATVMDLTNAYVPLTVLHSTPHSITQNPTSIHGTSFADSWPPMRSSSSCS